MKSKKCFGCKRILLIENFWKSKFISDGRKSTCIECSKKYMSEWRRINPERMKELKKRDYIRNNEKYKTYREENRKRLREQCRVWYAENKERTDERSRAWREANRDYRREIEKVRRMEFPEKIAAIKAVANAVRSGKLIKIDWCQLCGKAAGKKKVEAHHGSYAKEHQLNVVWLCHLHHRQIHSWLRERNE